MDQDLKPEPTNYRKVLVIIGLVIGALLFWQFAAGRAEQRRVDEEIATAEGLARVISSTFSGKTDLRVSSISGKIDVTSVNHGRVFDSKLKATLPFSIDYFVDLSALSLADARYDSKNRTLFVEVPDVRISEPNINLAKGRVGDAEGWWVSRKASKVLVARAIKLSNQKAAEEAGKSIYVERARDEGRRRISQLLELPLNASGMGDVRVVVRYPPDDARTDERWDVSRSIQDVLNEAAQRRAEGKS